MRFLQTLNTLSHSQRFLWWMVTIIMLSGLALGGAIGLISDHDDELPQEGKLPAALDLLSLQPNKVLWSDAFAGSIVEATVLSAFDLSQQEQSIVKAFLKSIQLTNTNNQPHEALLALSQTEPTIRYANYALARFWELQGMRTQALAAYLKEADLAAADEARAKVVALLLELEMWPGLSKLLQKPDYIEHITPHVHYRLAIQDRNWFGLAYWIVVMLFSTVEPVYVGMAFVSGLAWLSFLLQAGQIRLRIAAPLGLMLLAFGAGVVSVFLTHGAVVIQEDLFGFTLPDSGLLSGLLYFFLGVGLREELCKLICFMPLVPVLLRNRQQRLMQLLLPAAVGLGFAAAENIFYYAGGLGAAAPARFLSANFFHIAATGLCGYAFCQIFIEQHGGFNDFMATFVIVTAIHGLYNSLLALPELQGFELFATAVYILMCYQFFQVLHQWRAVGQEFISLTAHFLFALALVVAMALCFQAAIIGVSETIKIMFPELLGSALLVIMFIREIREPLAP